MLSNFKKNNVEEMCETTYYKNINICTNLK